MGSWSETLGSHSITAKSRTELHNLSIPVSHLQKKMIIILLL